MQIRDRIKEFRRVPANTLLPNPKNWRTHPVAQMDALKGVLSEIGFAGAELVRELEDGSLMLIDGHARAEVMGSNDIPVLIVDLNEQEADKLLTVFDPIGDLASSDKQILDSLLRDVEFSNEALQALADTVATKAGLYEDSWAEQGDIEEYDEANETVHIKIESVSRDDVGDLVARIELLLAGTKYKVVTV